MGLPLVVRASELGEEETKTYLLGKESVELKKERAIIEYLEASGGSTIASIAWDLQGELHMSMGEVLEFLDSMKEVVYVEGLFRAREEKEE